MQSSDEQGKAELREAEAFSWEPRTLELMREHFPALPSNLELLYIRGGQQADGFSCVAAKYKDEQGRGYRIHYHEGYTEGVDKGWPNTRIRSFEMLHKWDEKNSTSLVPDEQCYKI